MDPRKPMRDGQRKFFQGCGALVDLQAVKD